MRHFYHHPAFAKKAQLSLVSKLWKQLSAPVIYEHIEIYGSTKLSSLVWALDSDIRSGQRVAGGSSPDRSIDRARFIKRLYLGRYSVDSEVDSADDIRALEPLFARFANLQILFVSVEPDVLAPLLRTVRDRCPRLYHLFYRYPGMAMPNDNFLLPSTLRVLILIDVDVPRDLHISLPNLHTLKIGPDTDYFSEPQILEAVSRWEMPSLRRFIFLGGYLYDEERCFFQNFGPQLTSVNFLEYFDCGDSSPTLPEILEKCISLRELNLRCLMIKAFDPHPTLAEIVVCVDPDEGAMSDLERCMNKLFPSRSKTLESVTVLYDHFEMEHDAGYIEAVREWTERWAEEGVCLSVMAEP
jgi:hypothetical protein